MQLFIFTARRVCIARTMPSQDVRLSVCHTPVLSINGYTYPQFFLPSGSHTMLVFPYQTEWQYSDGEPPNGGAEYKGYEKITIFDQYLALSRNWCNKSHSYYGRWIGNRTQTFEWYKFQWPWVTSNPDCKVTIYSTSNNSKTVPDRVIFTMADQ